MNPYKKIVQVTLEIAAQKTELAKFFQPKTSKPLRWRLEPLDENKTMPKRKIIQSMSKPSDQSSKPCFSLHGIHKN